MTPAAPPRLDAASAFGVVRRAVGVVLDIAPAAIDLDTRFDSLEADSLALVGIADVVERAVSAEWSGELAIDDATLARLVTVGDLVELVVADVTR